MSLEHDITMLMEDDIFKPASKQDADARKTEYTNVKIEDMKKNEPERWAGLQKLHTFKKGEEKYIDNDIFSDTLYLMSPNQELTDSIVISMRPDRNSKNIYYSRGGGSRSYSALDFNKAVEKYGGFVGYTPEEAYNKFMSAFKEFESTLTKLGMIQ